MGVQRLTRGRVLVGGVQSENESVVQYRTTVLTDAQIKALRATPIELVPAQGTGKFIEFVSALLHFDVTTTGYTETADNLAIRQTNGAGALVSQAIETTGFLDQSSDKVTNALPKIDQIGVVSNASLVLHNTGDGEVTGGNAANTLSVKVGYRVHTVSF
jgi:hypothetical protein